MRHGGVGASPVGAEYETLLRSQSAAASVWRWQRLHRGHNGARTIPGPHEALPLPEGKCILIKPLNLRFFLEH